MSFESYGQPIVDFVRTHEAWAAPVVFAFAFGELLAFLSLIVPGWALLVGIGALIGTGDIRFWPIWVAASIGSALGDWLSFWIGLKLERKAVHVWPLSRHPDLIPRGEAFVKRWVYWGFHRALLRTTARGRAARRRHLRDALFAIPNCQLRIGIRVVSGGATIR